MSIIIGCCPCFFNLFPKLIRITRKNFWILLLQTRFMDILVFYRLLRCWLLLGDNFKLQTRIKEGPFCGISSPTQEVLLQIWWDWRSFSCNKSRRFLKWESNIFLKEESSSLCLSLVIGTCSMNCIGVLFLWFLLGLGFFSRWKFLIIWIQVKLYRMLGS